MERMDSLSELGVKWPTVNKPDRFLPKSNAPQKITQAEMQKQTQVVLHAQIKILQVVYVKGPYLSIMKYLALLSFYVFFFLFLFYSFFFFLKQKLTR